MSDQGSYGAGSGGGYGYGGSGGYGSYSDSVSQQQETTDHAPLQQQQAILRRRQQMYDANYMSPAGNTTVRVGSHGSNNGYYGGGGAAASTARTSSANSSPRKAVVKKLDFMFPKVDSEYTVKTDSGGIASVIGYILLAILSLAEIAHWSSQNGRTIERAVVDTSMGKRMRVNVNITFPSLACEDLHLDIMDIAGDSHMDIEASETMHKLRLNRRGLPMGEKEVMGINKHRKEQDERKRILEQAVPDDYCGPCYGAEAVNETLTGNCCNTCDELVDAYKKKRWRADVLIQAAEQCIREGRDKSEIKKLRHGEGCNLAGYFNINRVGGNFHIAMGEGVERDGRHIHTFNPDDTQNFNASHIIHHLSFGPEYDYEGRGKSKKKNNIPTPTSKAYEIDQTSLNGLTKIVDKEYGTTGLFQYFIKIVPTTYITKTKGITIETNRYYFTERFRPMMKEYITDDAYFGDEHDFEDDYDDGFFTDDETPNPNRPSEEERKKRREEREARKKARLEKKIKSAQAGGVGGHANHEHHNVKNAVLPGVFFIYEIYPFAVEVSQEIVPITHLLIRLMATVGGLFTIIKLFDSFFS
jgi:endoplasmic reticulum-Golgi intermediate compartment protein 3